MLSDEEIAEWLVETEKQNLEREKQILHIYEEEIVILKKEILLLENDKTTKEVISIENIPINIIEDRKKRAKLEHDILLQFIESTQKKLLDAISKYDKQLNVVSELKNVYKNALDKALITAKELA